MAYARQRDARSQIVSQATLVWLIFSQPSPVTLLEFIRCGQLDDGLERIPYNPAIARKIEEIRANDGKLIVETPNGTQ